jgi:hypothetical protein
MTRVFYEFTDSYGKVTTFNTYPELQKALAKSSGTFKTKYERIPEKVHICYRGAHGVTKSEYKKIA